jgi:CubicO group peptidase (beta-lactamase class C family)
MAMRLVGLVLLGVLSSATGVCQERDPLLPEPMPAEYREIAARADAYFTALYQAKRFNGSVLLHRGKWTILKKGYGMANFEWNNPNTPSTKFRVGSITKPFTAMAILMLEEQGKLKVDDPIGKYLPDYPKPAADQVTIHHLLTHTSGIPSYTDGPEYAKFMAHHFTTAEMIARFKDKPLEFPPGSKFKYSNSGYFLLGAIIEKASKQPYEHFLQVNILDQAAMHDSGYDHSRTLLKNRASGYDPGEPDPKNAPYLDMDQPYSAGSLYSTVEDLYQWDQVLYRSTLVTRQTLDRIFQPRVAAGDMGEYGYGWAISTVKGHRNVAHGGGINGFTSYISRFPNDNAMFVYLRNVMGPLPPSMNEEVAGILFGEKIEPPKEWKVVAIRPSALDALAGRYELGPQRSLMVRREFDKLLAEETDLDPLEVFPLSETRFFSRTANIEIEFVKDGKGGTDHIVLHQGGRTTIGHRVP